MLDTVTFDLWNTLLSNKPQDYYKYRSRRLENLKRVLRQHGKEIGFDNLLRAYLKGFDECKETWRKNLDLSAEEQLQTMFDFVEDENLRPIPPALMPHLLEAYVSPILEDPPDLTDGSEEILAQTRRKGYKIGLICNTGTTPGKTITVLLERLGMMKYFDVTTFSNELKIRKPDPRIFLYTLGQLESQPQSAAHVGDLIDADVWGARNVGMISVHYNPDLVPSDDITPDFAIVDLKQLNWILGDLR